MSDTPRTDANTFSTYDGFSTKAPVIRVVRREVCAEIEGELSALKAQLAECEKDAQRYRWLKVNHFQTGADSWIRTGDDLEEAIDAAMNADQK